MVDFDPTTPGNSDLISNYPANERAERQKLEDWVNFDHFEADGKHRAARFKELAGDPTVIANEIALYSKLVGGQSELFIKDENALVFQMTNAGEFQTPLTARGDLLTRNATVLTRLARGTANQVLRSDGTDLAWVTPTPGFDFGSLPLIPLPRGHISGLGMTWTDANTITSARGMCRNNGDNDNIVLLASLAKDIDATWVAGAGGGLNATDFASGGSDAEADTWYHVFVIDNGAGVEDVGFDKLLNAGNLLADASYTNARRIGSVLTDASRDILEFTQVGDHFLWVVPVNDLPAEALVTASRTATLSTPLGVKCWAQIHAVHDGNISEKETWIHSPDQTDAAANEDIGRGTVLTGQAGGSGSANVDVRTGTASNVRYVSSVASAQTLGISTQGWFDRRGQDD